MSFFIDQSREQLRAAYRDAWRKQCERVPLSALEAQIAAVIEAHPEYQPLLQAQAPAAALPAAAAEPNPFLHMGLHLALREQLATNRPAGITQIHRALQARFGSSHAAEHRMIDVLGSVLWEAQRSARAPDEALYLERLRAL